MAGHRLGGYEVGRTVTPRDILAQQVHTLQVPIVLSSTGYDGSNGDYTFEIREGWLMGKITATKKWVPCKRTLVNDAAEVSSSAGNYTTFVVNNAAAFKVGDAIDVGNFTNKTITAVNYSTNEITINDDCNIADNDVVKARDGSETCRGILIDFVRLRQDDNLTACEGSGGMLVHGLVLASQVLGDLEAVRADTGAKLGGIYFDEDYQP